MEKVANIQTQSQTKK